MKKQFTSGQMKMELASQLARVLPADVAFAMAMDSVDSKRVPDKWRSALPDKFIEAIDGDLADPKTWGATS